MICPSCGKEAMGGARFCNHCGATLPAEPAPQIVYREPQTSGMAITSLVLGIMGICYGLTSLPGLIVGIIAYRDIERSQGQIGGKGLAIAGIATSAATMLIGLVALIGILAAIAIPNFLRFQARSRQTEAKQNLAEIYTAQAAHFADYSQYGKTFAEIKWSPAGTTRYSYYLSPEEFIPAGAGGSAELPLEIEPWVIDDQFQIVAVGNVDNDPTLDVWTINENKELKNVVNDLRE